MAPRNYEHDYDWLVIGSGFGGSVSALRLAEKGYRVAVLECGRRFADEDFAKTTWEAAKYYWMPKLRLKGIFRLTLFKDVFVASGCGVGGGSLGYANTLYRAAALRLPAKTPWFDDPEWASTGDILRVDANYMLLHEHYLDLTNVFVMHPEAVPPGIETLPPLDEVEVSEMSVAYSRSLPVARLADWEAETTGLPRDTECARREEGTFVSPALHAQRYTIEAEGSPLFEHLRVQGFTPESLTTTHVFLQIARNYATDRAVVADLLRSMFHEWALRDAPVLETVQRRLGEELEPRRDINVKADRAAVRARRVAQEMVDEEAGRGFALHPNLAGTAGR